ncbi:MAG TPA: hypothetical protein VII56_01660 [Rhizomicrobium sp.]
MRIPTIRGTDALRERLSAPQQIDASIAESAMPPYMESFLAHLRLLIGAPFDYLVPDSRLLPDESIRFFYLDRSWTDRLIDGALAVGKAGTRDMAHHAAHAPNVQSQLDLSERAVRDRQRGRAADAPGDPAGIVTGFLLRSAAVSGWPSMDVRAFDTVLPAPVTDMAAAQTHQLRTLRLELLSPSVLLALFDGIPKLVWCEEPHGYVKFGMTLQNGAYYLDRHENTGEVEPTETPAQMVRVPMRAANTRVVAVQALRRRLYALHDLDLVAQTGSAAFAIEMLDLPWRQRFQNDNRNARSASFVPAFTATAEAVRLDLAVAVERLL